MYHNIAGNLEMFNVCLKCRARLPKVSARTDCGALLTTVNSYSLFFTFGIPGHQRVSIQLLPITRHEALEPNTVMHM